MKRSSLIQIMLALVLALGAGFLVFRSMEAPRPQNVVVQKLPTVGLVVATAEIPKGTKIIAEQLKLVDFLEASAPVDTFRSAEDLVGQRVISSVRAGELVTTAVLADEKNSISYKVTPGMRAVSLRGNDVLGMAGLIWPGNRVDVLVSIEDGSRDENRTYTTKTILENIRVLATGSELRPGGDGAMTLPVDVYTLELLPEQVEVLSLAASRGQVHFALRNPEDADAILTKGADVPEMLSALLPPEAEKKPVRNRVVSQRFSVVEVISGTERSTLRLK